MQIAPPEIKITLLSAGGLRVSLRRRRGNSSIAETLSGCWYETMWARFVNHLSLFGSEILLLIAAASFVLISLLAAWLWVLPAGTR
jgi:hypothetical protein